MVEATAIAQANEGPEVPDDVYDYEEGLVTTITDKAAVEAFIRAQEKKFPALRQSLFAAFVRKIREEQHTSKYSNIPDQLAYRTIQTIKTEPTALR